MKILIACEFSGAEGDEFISLGHEVVSCDILPCEGQNPVNHYQGNVEDILDSNWVMIIAFPPCTHLAVSGARYFKEKIADGRQQKAIDFFMLFANANCDKICIENPVGIMSTKWRKSNQIIQPWQFGHDASKKTCLWLTGLPLLNPTDVVLKKRYANQTPSGQNNLGPSLDRAKLRSKTYSGIAESNGRAMGELNNGNK